MFAPDKFDSQSVAPRGIAGCRGAAKLVSLLLVFALASCRPASYEQFLRCDQAEGGEYVFMLDMSDTLSDYDVSFYSRIDAPVMESAKPASQMALSVSWFAPQGTAPSLSETVYLPYGGAAGSVRLYRSGVRVEPLGEWRVSVRPQDAPEGLRGIGIICKRNLHGTR